MASNLRSGKQRSCGCYREEIRRTHGKSNSSIYRRWNAMLMRCQDPKHQSFGHYGGRGIKVCERWQKFDDFYADVGDPPAGMTLDRVDNDRGYSPDNVRWATPKEQMANRRGTKEMVLLRMTVEELRAEIARKEGRLGVFS